MNDLYRLPGEVEIQSFSGDQQLLIAALAALISAFYP
jgi:hypothetical protein